MPKGGKSGGNMLDIDKTNSIINRERDTWERKMSYGTVTYLKSERFADLVNGTPCVENSLLG